MKQGDIKWPKEDILMAPAKARMKELKHLCDWHTLSDSDCDIIQKELDILATMVNKKALKKQVENKS